MGRSISVMLALVVLVIALLLPEMPSATLATRAVGDLITAPLPDQEAVPEEEQRSLFDALSETYGDQLPLAGFRFDAEAGSGADINDTFAARSNLVRALRTAAQQANRPDFVVLGELGPEAEGLSGHVRYEAGRLVGAFVGPGEEVWPVDLEVKLPRRSSVWPPLVAVALAILFRRPLVALFLGVLTGTLLLNSGGGLAGTLIGGTRELVTVYFWNEFWNEERGLIIGFVVFMLAMVGILTRSGAIRGLMDAIAKRANSPRGTQISTYLMGLAIFFDDYANTILVGSTMRPLTDKHLVSREKLAYLVDSTAAPVAGLSIFSTWIAFEVSTFSAQLPTAGLKASDGYAIFLQSVPYSFYCIFTLLFVAWIVFSGRDFGPMRHAERRAGEGRGLLRPGATPMVSEAATSMEPHPSATPRLSRAVLALGAFLVVTLLEIARGGGLFGLADGTPFFRAELLTSIEGVTSVLYQGSGGWPLFVGSLAGLLVAIGGALRAGLDVPDVLASAWRTLRAMGVAFAILYLAWMIGAVTTDLGTAGYLTAFVGDAIPPGLLPTGLFFLAGLIAFATGSSWSTMSILLPIGVPLAYHLGLGTELLETAEASGRALMVMSIGAVLSGAIFGDHCSPISDTTVMSSIASASDHIDHVRTQAPYAIAVMVVSVFCGYLPAAHGTSPWLCLFGGAVAISGVVLLFGRKPAHGV